MKNLKLKFNMEDWIDILSSIHLKQTDPEQEGFSEGYKKEIIAKNLEKKIFSEFLENLEKKKAENKELIRNASKIFKAHPFPELIDIPKTKNKFIEGIILHSFFKKIENKEYYYKFLEVNKKPNFAKLIYGISSESRRNNVVFHYNSHKNEDSYLNIFQSAIALCPPYDVQNAFEYFIDEYKQLEEIDSKKETNEKRNQILREFHKSLRQANMFGNGHVESIIYNLWQATDVPARIMIAVADYINEEKMQKI